MLFSLFWVMLFLFAFQILLFKCSCYNVKIRFSLCLLANLILLSTINALNKLFYDLILVFSAVNWRIISNVATTYQH